MRVWAVFALLSLSIAAGCGDAGPGDAWDAAVDDSSADGGVGAADAAAPTCSDGLENGSEEGVDCGGSCDACVECAAPTECESGVCSSGTCAVTRFESCGDLAPTNAASTVVDVVTTFTSGSGWSEPAACAWDCNADYATSGEACINEREVQCTDVAPSNAASTIATVTIGYTDAGQWAAPADCVWACDSDYAQDGNACINSQQVSCNDAAPANASSTSSTVTISYTDEAGWTAASDCVWACDSDYALDTGTCINERTVSCNDAAPANSSSVAANVTISYTTAAGWTAPANCAWSCNTDYDRDADTCINQATVACIDVAPDHGSSTVVNEDISYTTASGWTTPSDCEWSCDTDYVQDGNACINTQLVACNDAAPANASSTNADVSIGYTTAGGWSDPADCAWSCDTDYAQDGNTCINSQVVSCENLFPANGTTIPQDQTITYTDADGWTSPAACSFVCDSGYCRSGNQCQEAFDTFYVEERYETDVSGVTWFGGDNRLNIGPRNLGAGQRLELAAEVDLARFAFYYKGAFDPAQGGGPSIAVTLQLDLRDVDGNVLATTQAAVPASFVEGWVWFDMVYTLRADTPYYFTSFLVNGYQLGVNSAIMNSNTVDQYTSGYRILSLDSDGLTDLASWAPWSDTNSTTDHWFWVRSGAYCM